MGKTLRRLPKHPRVKRGFAPSGGLISMPASLRHFNAGVYKALVGCLSEALQHERAHAAVIIIAPPALQPEQARHLHVRLSLQCNAHNLQQRWTPCTSQV